MADIEEIRARAEAATPGPWQTGPSWAGKGAVLTAEGHPITVCGDGPDAAADARWIAAARQDVADLLAEVDRLRAALDKAVRQRDSLGRRCGVRFQEAEQERDRAERAEAERDAAYAQADRLRGALQRVRGLNRQNLAAVGKAQRRCDAESAEADRLRTELAEAQLQAESYRTLADHIGALAPESWDGEDSELSVLCAFVDHLAARVPAEQRERWPEDDEVSAPAGELYVTPGHPTRLGVAGYDCMCGECRHARTARAEGLAPCPRCGAAPDADGIPNCTEWCTP